MWEPSGAQPPNSHPDSTEIFVVLRGEGRAFSDEHSVGLRAGDVLILPPGSVHRIVNTSPTERLYTVTIMANDPGALPGGFAALVDRGTRSAGMPPTAPCSKGSRKAGWAAAGVAAWREYCVPLMFLRRGERR